MRKEAGKNMQVKIYIDDMDSISLNKDLLTAIKTLTIKAEEVEKQLSKQRQNFRQFKDGFPQSYTEDNEDQV